MRLNGWRRLGVLLSALWLVAFASLFAYEAATHGHGLLMTHELPKGAIFAGDTLTLPSGATYKLPALHLKGEPWEQNWQELPPEAFTERRLKTGLIAGGLALPVLLWLFVEVAVLLWVWVRAGFASKNKT